MRGISPKTGELIRYAYRLLKSDHPQTLRQLHYAIFSRGEIEYANTQADYKRLSRATTVARRAHREWELAGEIDAPPLNSIPSHWMVDETREGETVSVWQDVHEYLETVRNAYRRDNWQSQVSYCELWSEKATILGALRPVARKWGITVRVCHGFGSTGMEGQIGRLFETIDQDITVFYVGDHDASGHVIEKDIHGRAQRASGVDFHMVRLAIHAEDIKQFNLPPQQIKDSDSRAASFRRQFGANAATVELDALPASELRRRLEASVKDLIDFELWDRQIHVQEIELQCIRDFADRIKNLSQVNPEAQG